MNSKAPEMIAFDEERRLGYKESHKRLTHLTAEHGRLCDMPLTPSMLTIKSPKSLCATRNGEYVFNHTPHAPPHNSHLTPHTSHATRHTTHVTRHTPHATRHTSHVTRHTSRVTRHTSHIAPVFEVKRSGKHLLVSHAALQHAASQQVYIYIYTG